MSSDYRLRALSATRTWHAPAPHSFQRQRRRATALLAAAIGTLGLSRAALAATAVWDGGTNGAGAAWLLGTNWNPDLPSPGPGATDLAQFDAAGIAVNIGIDANGATNNGAANQAVGQVLLSGGINRTIINSSTIIGGLLTLNGVDGVMLSNTTASGTLTLSTTTSNTLGVVLGTSGAFNVAADNGHITISSIVSETGGARALTKTGAGTLTLGGENTFSGGMTIGDGTVSVATLANAGVAQPLGMATFAVGLGGATTAGTLDYTGADVTIDRGFALGAGGGGINTANELTLTSAITGSGALTKSGAGTLTLGGAGGAIAGAAEVVIDGGTLRLNNQPGANNNDRIGDTTSVTLDGGVLRIDMDVDAVTTEIAGALHITGGANAVSSFGSAGAALAASRLTFQSMARSGGAVSFEPAAVTEFRVISTPALANGILGGWATFADTDWATIDANSGRVMAYTGYNTAADPATWTAADNISADAARNVAASTSINSLRLTGSGVAVTVDPAATLNVANGVLVTGAGHTIGGGGALTAGTLAGAELILNVAGAGSDVAVATPIPDNAGGAVTLSKAGAGLMVLDAAATHTGGTNVLAGTLRLGAAGSVSASPMTIDAGGTFDVNNLVTSVRSLSGAGAVNLGSGTLKFGGDNADTAFAGSFSGSGGVITKVGSGTMILSGASTHTGGNNIGDTNGVDTGGVLVVDGDNRLGDPAATVNLYNGTIRFVNGAGITGLVTSVPIGTPGVLLSPSRNFTLNAGNGKFDVPDGNYVEIAGTISDGAAGASPLHKIGGGVLDFRTASNTFTGGMIIDGGTVGVNRDLNFGAVPAEFDPDAIQLNNGATIKWYSSGTLATAGVDAKRGITIGAGGGVIEWAHSSGVPNLHTQITSAAGNTLTKRGSNTVLVQVAQPTMNGDLNINQGRYNVQVTGAAGNGTIYLTAADTGITNTSMAQLGIGGTVSTPVTITQPIVLAPTGGNNSFEVNAPSTLILNGNISGTGGLTKGRVNNTTGLLVLGGNNTYTGGNTIRFGTLQVGDNANLGEASNGIALGGAGAQATLKITGNLSAGGRDVTTDSGGGAVDTNGFDATLGNVNGTANFVKNSDGRLTVNHVRANHLNVNGGTLAMAPSSLASGVSSVNTVSIAADARLDLTDNKLITTTAPGTATAGVYDGLQREVQRAYNFTSWDGPGLTTSMPAARQGLTTIGISTGTQIRGLGETDTALWGGQTITGASTLAMYTYAGDANLDGQIDAGDYGIIDNFVQIDGASGYGNGDFNYDGFIDAGDYGIIDNNVQAQGTPFSTSGSASSASLSGVTAVPEPRAIALLASPLACLLRRRRRGG